MSTTLPSRSTVGTVLAVVGSFFIIYVGVNYLLAPQSTAPDFGLPSWPRGEGSGFLAVKGVRDIVSGLVVLAVLAAGNRRVLGWVMLATALTPLATCSSCCSPAEYPRPPSACTAPPPRQSSSRALSC
ncbi:DUF4267 domain-containing protein [Nonomuraea recticatena]|uniref:DUF4267 domain-containing protein n=1 Tax=Nonomuraea recticatena TaxID=46178 RepID=UPI00360B4584